MISTLYTPSRLLLRVLDTLPRGGGGGSKVGFSWVLGVRALGLRGVENFHIVFTQ